jgi:DNA-binding MarR family transcriptional regulator
MVQQINTELLPDGGNLLPWLSERQYECLRFVYHYAVDKRDYPLGPEIAAHMNITKQAVTPLINTLIKKGYMVRDRSIIQRNIRLTPAAVEKMNREEGEGTTPDMFSTLPGGQ